MGKSGTPPTLIRVQVTFVGPMSAGDAELCRHFGVAATDSVRPDPDAFHLQRIGERLRLVAPGGKLELEIDPHHGRLAQRLRTARRSEPLPRAIGLRRRLPTVVDATAGLGRDAMVLATLGCRVTAIESIGALAMMLNEAIGTSTLADSMTVQHGDAVQLLAKASAAPPEVVYLDPMFTDHGKAQVKKEVQMLRQLAGAPQDVGALFTAARAAAAERVVVKRSPASAALATPDFTVAGGNVRFDVYLSKS